MELENLDRELVREAHALSRVRAVAAASHGPSPRRLMAAGIIGVVVLAACFLTGTFTAIHIIDDAAVAAEQQRATVALERELGAGTSIDTATAESLAFGYSLSGARFTEPDALAPGEASVALPEGVGNGNAVLAWMPRRFATEAFNTVGPLRITLAMLIVLTIGAVLFRLHGLAQELERRRMLAHELASRDVLTGLRNRLTFDQELREAFSDKAARPLALLYLDLDDFKPVNDTLGHAAGDELLRLVGERLSALVEPTDTLARLGGDEFAVIRRTALARDELDSLAARMQAALTMPFVLEGIPATIGVSVGIAMAPEMARNATDLVRAADGALYRAKGNGGSCHAFASPFIPRPAPRRRAA